MVFNENEAPIEAQEQLKITPDIARILEDFVAEFQPKVDLVYYPCSGIDITPSTVFPTSRVLYVDTDQEAIKLLAKNGYEAVYHSALLFKPEEVDLEILLSPGLSTPIERISKQVRLGGYLICDNRHGTAYNLKEDPDFELVKTYPKSTYGEISVFQRTKLTPVDTEAEMLEDWEEAIRVDRLRRGLMEGEADDNAGEDISLEDLLGDGITLK